MSRQPHVRFAVWDKGRPRQLFSVKERKNGDLLISIPDEATADIGGHEVPIKDRHYSVHRRLKDEVGGATIKETILLENGELIENASLRTPVDGRFAESLFVQRISSRVPNNALLPDRVGDKKIFLHDRDMGAYTLIFSIVASDFNLTKADLAEAGMSIWQEDFTHFRVSALTGFVATTAHWSFDMQTSATNFPVYNRQHHHLEREINFSTESLSPSLLTDTILSSVEYLKAKYFERVMTNPELSIDPALLSMLLGTWFADVPTREEVLDQIVANRAGG